MIVQAEQTEAVTTEMLKNEQTLHIAQESIPSITDAKVENSTEIEETTAQEDAPNNTGTLYTDADAEKYNEDEKENTEIDAAVAKTSTDEQDGTTDETINEEVSPKKLLAHYEKFRHDLVSLKTSMLDQINSKFKLLGLSRTVLRNTNFSC